MNNTQKMENIMKEYKPYSFKGFSPKSNENEDL